MEDFSEAFYKQFEEDKAFTDNLNQLRKIFRKRYSERYPDAFFDQLISDLPSDEIAKMTLINLFEAQLESIIVNNHGSLSSFIPRTKDATKTQIIQDSPDRPRDATKYILNSTRKLICKETETKAEIEAIVKQAKIQGITSPNSLIAYAGGAVSAIIATSNIAGALTFAPAAGLVTIYILAIGLDAFCDWSKEYTNIW